MQTVVGLFDNVTEAQRAIEALEKYGLQASAISIVTRPLAQPALASTAHGGLRVVDTNDTGMVAAYGPLRDAIIGPGGSGSLVVALQRFGLSGDIAARYAAGVRDGETLESVVVDDAFAQDVVGIMQRYSHVGSR